MNVPSSIFLIASGLCIVMLLVLASLLRFRLQGIREWCMANAVAFVAYMLYALGRELPPIIAYEVANGAYAAASAVLLIGFRRFFARTVPVAMIAIGIVVFVAAIAIFHYWHDSFVTRTIIVSVFHGTVLSAIGLTILRSRDTWYAPYPHRFTASMAFVFVAGHAVRIVIYILNADTLTSLLQPSIWNVLSISAALFVMPVLTFGAMMMAHDRMMAKAASTIHRDFLTGAWSRRAFFEMLEREMARVARTHRRFSLLLLEVGLPSSGDASFDHANRDRALADVALRAGKVIRAPDQLARIGGEEFALLLPETEREAALVAANRLMQSIVDAQPTVTRDRANYTVSMGVAILRDGDSINTLMQRAAVARDAAKQSGPDRFLCEPGVKTAA